jgi:hypothetical protein
MGWRDRFDDDDDDIDIGRGRRGDPPGSAGWAIASFFISILDGIFLLFLIIGATIMEANQNAPLNDNDPRVIMLGFGILAGLAFSVLGLILGFVGIGQKNGTVFAILGITFNALLVVGVIALMCLGIAAG